MRRGWQILEVFAHLGARKHSGILLCLFLFSSGAFGHGHSNKRATFESSARKACYLPIHQDPRASGDLEALNDPLYLMEYAEETIHKDIPQPIEKAIPRLSDRALLDYSLYLYFKSLKGEFDESITSSFVHRSHHAIAKEILSRKKSGKWFFGKNALYPPIDERISSPTKHGLIVNWSKIRQSPSLLKTKVNQLYPKQLPKDHLWKNSPATTIASSFHDFESLLMRWELAAEKRLAPRLTENKRASLLQKERQIVCSKNREEPIAAILLSRFIRKTTGAGLPVTFRLNLLESPHASSIEYIARNYPLSAEQKQKLTSLIVEHAKLGAESHSTTLKKLQALEDELFFERVNTKAAYFSPYLLQRILSRKQKANEGYFSSPPIPLDALIHPLDLKHSNPRQFEHWFSQSKDQRPRLRDRHKNRLRQYLYQELNLVQPTNPAHKARARALLLLAWRSGLNPADLRPTNTIKLQNKDGFVRIHQQQLHPPNSKSTREFFKANPKLATCQLKLSEDPRFPLLTPELKKAESDLEACFSKTHTILLKQVQFPFPRSLRRLDDGQLLEFSFYLSTRDYRNQALSHSIEEAVREEIQRRQKNVWIFGKKEIPPLSKDGKRIDWDRVHFSPSLLSKMNTGLKALKGKNLPTCLRKNLHWQQVALNHEIQAERALGKNWSESKRYEMLLSEKNRACQKKRDSRSLKNLNEFYYTQSKIKKRSKAHGLSVWHRLNLRAGEVHEKLTNLANLTRHSPNFLGTARNKQLLINVIDYIASLDLAPPPKSLSPAQRGKYLKKQNDKKAEHRMIVYDGAGIFLKKILEAKRKKQAIGTIPKVELGKLIDSILSVNFETHRFVVGAGKKKTTKTILSKSPLPDAVAKLMDPTAMLDWLDSTESPKSSTKSPGTAKSKAALRSYALQELNKLKVSNQNPRFIPRIEALSMLLAYTEDRSNGPEMSQKLIEQLATETTLKALAKIQLPFGFGSLIPLGHEGPDSPFAGKELKDLRKQVWLDQIPRGRGRNRVIHLIDTFFKRKVGRSLKDSEKFALGKLPYDKFNATYLTLIHMKSHTPKLINFLQMSKNGWVLELPKSSQKGPPLALIPPSVILIPGKAPVISPTIEPKRKELNKKLLDRAWTIVNDVRGKTRNFEGVKYETLQKFKNQFSLYYKQHTGNEYEWKTNPEELGTSLYRLLFQHRLALENKEPIVFAGPDPVKSLANRVKHAKQERLLLKKDFSKQKWDWKKLVHRYAPILYDLTTELRAVTKAQQQGGPISNNVHQELTKLKGELRATQHWLRQALYGHFTGNTNIRKNIVKFRVKFHNFQPPILFRDMPPEILRGDKFWLWNWCQKFRTEGYLLNPDPKHDLTDKAREQRLIEDEKEFRFAVIRESSKISKNIPKWGKQTFGFHQSKLMRYMCFAETATNHYVDPARERNMRNLSQWGKYDRSLKLLKAIVHNRLKIHGPSTNLIIEPQLDPKFKQSHGPLVKDILKMNKEFQIKANKLHQGKGKLNPADLQKFISEIQEQAAQKPKVFSAVKSIMQMYPEDNLAKALVLRYSNAPTIPSGEDLKKQSYESYKKLAVLIENTGLPSNVTLQEWDLFHQGKRANGATLMGDPRSNSNVFYVGDRLLESIEKTHLNAFGQFIHQPKFDADTSKKEKNSQKAGDILFQKTIKSLFEKRFRVPIVDDETKRKALFNTPLDVIQKYRTAKPGGPKNKAMSNLLRVRWYLSLQLGHIEGAENRLWEDKHGSFHLFPPLPSHLSQFVFHGERWKKKSIQTRIGRLRQLIQNAITQIDRFTLSLGVNSDSLDKYFNVPPSTVHQFVKNMITGYSVPWTYKDKREKSRLPKMLRDFQDNRFTEKVFKDSKALNQVFKSPIQAITEYRKILKGKDRSKTMKAWEDLLRFRWYLNTLVSDLEVAKSSIKEKGKRFRIEHPMNSKMREFLEANARSKKGIEQKIETSQRLYRSAIWQIDRLGGSRFREWIHHIDSKLAKEIALGNIPQAIAAGFALHKNVEHTIHLGPDGKRTKIETPWYKKVTFAGAPPQSLEAIGQLPPIFYDLAHMLAYPTQNHPDIGRTPYSHRSRNESLKIAETLINPRIGRLIQTTKTTGSRFPGTLRWKGPHTISHQSLFNDHIEEKIEKRLKALSKKKATTQSKVEAALLKTLKSGNGVPLGFSFKNLLWSSFRSRRAPEKAFRLREEVRYWAFEKLKEQIAADPSSPSLDELRTMSEKELKVVAHSRQKRGTSLDHYQGNLGTQILVYILASIDEPIEENAHTGKEAQERYEQNGGPYQYQEHYLLGQLLKEYHLANQHFHPPEKDGKSPYLGKTKTETGRRLARMLVPGTYVRDKRGRRVWKDLDPVMKWKHGPWQNRWVFSELSTKARQHHLSLSKTDHRRLDELQSTKFVYRDKFKELLQSGNPKNIDQAIKNKNPDLRTHFRFRNKFELRRKVLNQFKKNGKLDEQGQLALTQLAMLEGAIHKTLDQSVKLLSQDLREKAAFERISEYRDKVLSQIKKKDRDPRARDYYTGRFYQEIKLIDDLYHTPETLKWQPPTHWSSAMKKGWKASLPKRVAAYQKHASLIGELRKILNHGTYTDGHKTGEAGPLKQTNPPLKTSKKKANAPKTGKLDKQSMHLGQKSRRLNQAFFHALRHSPITQELKQKACEKWSERLDKGEADVEKLLPELSKVENTKRKIRRVIWYQTALVTKAKQKYMVLNQKIYDHKSAVNYLEQDISRMLSDRKRLKKKGIDVNKEVNSVYKLIALQEKDRKKAEIEKRQVFQKLAQLKKEAQTEVAKYKDEIETLKTQNRRLLVKLIHIQPPNARVWFQDFLSSNPELNVVRGHTRLRLIRWYGDQLLRFCQLKKQAKIVGRALASIPQWRNHDVMKTFLAQSKKQGLGSELKEKEAIAIVEKARKQAQQKKKKRSDSEDLSPWGITPNVNGGFNISQAKLYLKQKELKERLKKSGSDRELRELIIDEWNRRGKQREFPLNAFTKVIFDGKDFQFHNLVPEIDSLSEKSKELAKRIEAHKKINKSWHSRVNSMFSWETRNVKGEKNIQRIYALLNELKRSKLDVSIPLYNGSTQMGDGPLPLSTVINNYHTRFRSQILTPLPRTYERLKQDYAEVFNERAFMIATLPLMFIPGGQSAWALRALATGTKMFATGIVMHGAEGEIMHLLNPEGFSYAHHGKSRLKSGLSYVAMMGANKIASTAFKLTSKGVLKAGNIFQRQYRRHRQMRTLASLAGNRELAKKAAKTAMKWKRMENAVKKVAKAIDIGDEYLSGMIGMGGTTYAIERLSGSSHDKAMVSAKTMGLMGLGFDNLAANFFPSTKARWLAFVSANFLMDSVILAGPAYKVAINEIDQELARVRALPSTPFNKSRLAQLEKQRSEITLGKIMLQTALTNAPSTMFFGTQFTLSRQASTIQRHLANLGTRRVPDFYRLLQTNGVDLRPEDVQNGNITPTRDYRSLVQRMFGFSGSRILLEVENSTSAATLLQIAQRAYPENHRTRTPDPTDRTPEPDSVPTQVQQQNQRALALFANRLGIRPERLSTVVAKLKHEEGKKSITSLRTRLHTLARQEAEAELLSVALNSPQRDSLLKELADYGGEAYRYVAPMELFGNGGLSQGTRQAILRNIAAHNNWDPADFGLFARTYSEGRARRQSNQPNQVFISWHEIVSAYTGPSALAL